MNTKICYFPLECDKKISERFINEKTWIVSPDMVATLRAAYDKYMNEPLNLEDINDTYNKLKEFRVKLLIEQAKSINDIVVSRNPNSKLGSRYTKLKETMDPLHIDYRVNMIASMFSQRLSTLQKMYPNLTKEELCNGVNADGKLIGGQFDIYLSILKFMYARESQFRKASNRDNISATEASQYRIIADKYKQIIENWDSLVALSRVKLAETEGIALNTRINYSKTLNSDELDQSVKFEFDESEARREHWQENNDEKSSYKSIGELTRKVISTLDTGLRDDLGNVIYANPALVHRRLSIMLKGSLTSKRMLRKLKKYAESRQELGIDPSTDIYSQLYNILKSNPTIKTAFFVDLRKGWQSYTITRKEGSITKTINLNDNSEKSFGNLITRIRLGKSTTTTIFDNNGNLVLSNITSFKSSVNNLMREDISISDKLVYLNEALRAIGYNVSLDTLTEMIINEKEYNRIINLLNTIKRSRPLNDDVLKNINELLEHKLIHATVKDILRQIGNTIDILNTDYNIATRVSYTDNQGRNNTFDSFITPNFTTNFFDDIQYYVNNKDIDGLRNMIRSKFLVSNMYYDGNINEEINSELIKNVWLRELWNSDLNDTRSFANNISYSRYLGDDTHVFEDFTSKQHLLTIWQYYNSNRDKGNKDYASYPMFILGDSGVAKFITAKRYSDLDIVEELYKVYENELLRWSNTAELESSGVNIHNLSKHRGVFTLLPFLNNLRISYVENGEVKEGILDRDVWLDDSINSIKNKIDIEDTVKKAIASYMKLEVEKIKNTMLDFEVISIDSEGNYNTDNLNIPNTKLDEYLVDFINNYKFAMIQQLQLFAEDPAFYDNIEDLQKRFKQSHAPGSEIDTDALWEGEDVFTRRNSDGMLVHDTTETVMYLKDIKKPAKEEFLNISKNSSALGDKIASIYSKGVSLTDGQGWRTLPSYRKIMIGGRKWTKQHERTYNRIMAIRSKDSLDENDIKEIAELSTVFQPIKPFLFGKETINTGNSTQLIPVQHKYAEVVLIPELLPDGILKDMANYMEDNDVDVVLATSCVKVGSWGEGTLDTSSGETSIIKTFENAQIHRFDYSDYRIQTNVPEDINSLHLIGTQARKLVLSGINTTDINRIYSYLKDSDGNYVNEVCLRADGAMTSSNGDAIVSLFNLLNALNIIDSFKVFTNKLMNKEELSEALIQLVIYNNRESKDKLYAYSLTEEGDFLSPLFDPSIEYDVTAAIFSMYKKLVNKQKIAGGSLVQASAFGSGLSRTDYTGELSYIIDPRGNEDPAKANILYAECEVPFDLSITNSEGVKTELDYNDWVNTDGTLKMSGEYLTESDPRYYDYLSWKTEDNKVQIPLIEKYYPGILGIIAYRIPTERAYSMINLKIKRFSKKVEGGVIRVPLEGTAIAGFDFDIDKLYLMRKEFKLKALTKEDISKVWKLFYESNPRIKEALKSAKMDDLIDKAKASGSNNTLTTEEFNTLYNNLKTRLYMYWKEAGLEGSYKDAFNYFVSFMYNTFKDDYDYTKSPFSQSRTARNNAMIQLFQGRLSDPETMGARYTPGGFAQHSTEARIERELSFGDLEGVIGNDGKVDFTKLEQRAENKNSDPRPNYDPTSIETLIIYNQQNQVAGKLIGVFANHNANHNFSSLMRKFELKNPIAFGEHCITGLYDFKSPPKGVDTDLNIAECLAASVDAVKDPTLNYLNYNTITADSAALLLRLGYSVRDVGLLLNQPIIKEICEYKFNNSVSLDQAIRKMVSKYENIGIKESEIPSTAVSSNRLALSIIKQRKDYSDVLSDGMFIETQLKAASVFSVVASKASELSSFVTTFKFTASNSIEPTFGGAFQKMDKVSSYRESSLPSFNVEVGSLTPTGISKKDKPLLKLSPEELISKIMDNPFAYEDISYECYLETIKYLVDEYYPYSNYAYTGARNIMKNLASDGSLSSKDIDSIHLGVLSYIISNSTHTNSPFNPKGHHHIDTSKGKIVTNLDYYIEEFPIKLYRFIESEDKQYLLDNYGPLIRSLLFKTDNADNLYISADYFNLHKEDTDNFIFYWEQLLRDDKIQSKFPNLATELFIYSYHKYSFSKSRESLLKLAPTKVKENTLVDSENNIYYFDFLKQIKKDIADIGNFEDFAKLYIRNNPKNYKFVYRVPNDSKEHFKSVGGTITIASDEARSRVLMDKIKTDRGIIYRWKPCIIVNGKMYIADCVSSEQFNWTSEDTITYIRTEPLNNRYYDIVKEDSKVDISADDSGSTRQDSEYIPSPSIDIDSETADTIKRMVANLSLHGMDISNSEAIISTLKVIHSELKTDILEQLLNEAREELRNGLYHLDSEGKVVKNCR